MGYRVSRFNSHNISERQICVWRHNKKLFEHKPAFRAIAQIIDDRLVRLGYRTGHGKHVDYQRPVGVCGSFFPTFKLVRRAEKAYIHVGGQFFWFAPTGLTYGVEGFAAASFSLTVAAGFLPVRRVTSLFSASTTSESHLTGAVNRWRTGRDVSTAY